MEEGWSINYLRYILVPIKPIPKKEWPIQPHIPIHYIYVVIIDKTNVMYTKGDAISWYFKGSVLDYETFSLPEYGSAPGLRLVFELINTVLLVM